MKMARFTRKTSPAVIAVASAVAVVSPASAYEVWMADQSDTGKESGGFLYIYDGAQLAADPASAKPTVTLDLSGDINTFCQSATQKPVRRPHMIFFSKDQSHAIISFLSGQVLFMDAATRKPEACLSMGKNVHAAWPTPDQKMAIAANMATVSSIPNFRIIGVILKQIDLMKIKAPCPDLSVQRARRR